jgi:UDP-3-O-[3-hydroxymyristoyl] glucosamine N-acyltransferase
MAAQSGVAGSTKLGSNCQIGGQAGIVGHIHIADKTLVQAQSGMTKSVKKADSKWYGSPAIDYNNYLKSFAIYKNLPDLQTRISKLEKLLEDLNDRSK